MRRDWRAFWLGFGIGMFVFLTGAGLLMVDYEGRKLSFGDDARGQGGPGPLPDEPDGKGLRAQRDLGRDGPGPGLVLFVRFHVYSP